MNHEATGEQIVSLRHSSEVEKLGRAIDQKDSALIASRALYVAAIKREQELADFAWEVLKTNGGPIDGDSTLDGKSYVMVDREAFNNLGAVLQKREGNLSHV